MNLSDKNKCEKGRTVMKLFDKVKASASIQAGKNAALNAADIAGKKATSVVEATKLNLKIFDLNTDIEVRYKEIGKIMYAVHVGEETDGERLQELMTEIDEKQETIRQLKEQLSQKKEKVLCPVCGRECRKEDEFCASCGEPLNAASEKTETEETDE